jgi:hypothetical protein
MPSSHVATIERELVPMDESPIQGVTFDGTLVWFARDDELVAFDPQTEKVVKRHSIPGVHAGTAFDGEHLYQLAHEEILVVDPADGRVVRTLPAPNGGACSGMAWADGYLFVGQYRARKIHKIDARTGVVDKTLTSDRFVTGVSCVEGALWHGTSGDGSRPELRRLAPDGSVDEALSVEAESIAGVEAAGEGAFWCAGERGKLRLVRRNSA